MVCGAGVRVRSRPWGSGTVCGAGIQARSRPWGSGRVCGAVVPGPELPLRFWEGLELGSGPGAAPGALGRL